MTKPEKKPIYGVVIKVLGFTNREDAHRYKAKMQDKVSDEFIHTDMKVTAVVKNKNEF